MEIDKLEWGICVMSLRFQCGRKARGKFSSLSLSESRWILRFNMKNPRDINGVTIYKDLALNGRVKR